jgi:hypothetical protein
VAAAVRTLVPSTTWARSISYLTWTLSSARKKGRLPSNSAAVTPAGLGCTSPAACSACLRDEVAMTAHLPAGRYPICEHMSSIESRYLPPETL